MLLSVMKTLWTPRLRAEGLVERAVQVQAGVHAPAEVLVEGRGFRGMFSIQ